MHIEEHIAIAKYDPNAAECRQIEDDVCLPAGSKRQSSGLHENSSSPQIENKFNDSGDRCVHYRIKVSSTNLGKKMCNGSKSYKCSACGAWYDGTVVLDGYTDTPRAWSRSITGTGQVEGKPQTNMTIKYSGILGSGLPDSSGLFGTPSYAANLTACSVACSNLITALNGDTLTVSTMYTQSVPPASKDGSGTLASTDNVKLIDSLPFTTENADVKHTVKITFQGTIYGDGNNDGYVDVGPFSFWTAGANDDQLFGAFDRTGFPVATIESIAPNPALFGQPVQFSGHGTGPFSTYLWLDQTNSPPLSIDSTFVRDDLKVGVHQIRFQVAGTNASPFTYASLRINQPPVAFINHIENVIDPAHASVSLLLHDGAQTDAFAFDGGGIDIDGSINAYEWTSDIEPGNMIGSLPQFQKSLTALGTHTIAFRVRDNDNIWSAPVKLTVVVRRPPVLLVHGICGDSSTWDEVINNGWLGPQWQTADIVRRTFDADNNRVTNDSPTDNAQLVWQEIQQMKQTYGVRTVDELVHSMGGLDSRAYIQSPTYQGDVNKLVMLATPNHGSSIADLTLISNGYSQKNVELYIPIPGVKMLLQTLGVIVDIVDWVSPTSTFACLGQDSPALHALRPHSEFLRNLNHTYKDEGTEDYGASGQPNDSVPSDTQYFVIHGERATVSHTHLPQWLVDSIRIATRGQVNFNHMSLLWVREGDSIVTSRSTRLDGVPSAHFDHGHLRMEKESDSVGKGLFYLLDDPPPATSDRGTQGPILGAHLLGAGRGTMSGQTSTPVELNVDAAAQRFRVSISSSTPDLIMRLPTDMQTERISKAPGLVLVLTAPSGVIYSSDAGKTGFMTTSGNQTIDATIEKPEAGAWKIALRTPPGMTLGRGELPYTWLAFEESSAFVALGLSAENVEPGDTVTVAAYVQNNGTGITGAEVRAATSNGMEKPVPITFAEDARVAGLYTAQFTPARSGTYRVLAAAKLPGSPAVTRFDFLNVESRQLPDLTISLSGPATQLRIGDAVTLVAKAENRGKSAASKIPVRFFDGLPNDHGRMITERILNLAPASVATVSIPWSATAGVHRLVAIIDPTNISGEANTADNVATLQLEVKDDRPPVARAGADQTAAVGQNIVLDGRASTDDDHIARYRWTIVPDLPVANGRLGNDAGFGIEGGYIVLPGFARAGTYIVRLTAVDPAGNFGSDDLVVRVVAEFDGEPPTARAGRDFAVPIGAPVKFNGMGSQDNYGIAFATWDIDLSRDSDGDGNPANDQDLAGLAPTLMRGYAKAGAYRARLTVRDAVGNGPSTDEVLVSVGVKTSTRTRPLN